MPKSYESSKDNHRTFCGDCGSQLTVILADEKEHTEFTVPTLDNPNAVRPGYHIWCDSQVKWIGFDDDGLPKFGQERQGS